MIHSGSRGLGHQVATGKLIGDVLLSGKFCPRMNLLKWRHSEAIPVPAQVCLLYLCKRQSHFRCLALRTTTRGGTYRLKSSFVCT